MRPRFLLLFVFASAVPFFAAERSAHADPIVSAASPSPGTEWYGWETLMTDGASGALVAAGLGTDDGAAQAPLVIAGLAGYGLGAPIVHAARGRWGLALADFGLRAGAVALGGLVGLGVGGATEGSPPPCNPRAAFGCLGDAFYGMDRLASATLVGASLGALAAATIDATVLSREKLRRKDEPAPSFSWSPTFSPLKDGAAGGIAGTF
jgi:hypothetical protein